MKVSMLTTVDNPFDPFDDFDSWYLYDCEKGYNSCSYLARIGKFSDKLTEQENNEEQERAIDEIIKCNPLNIYRKVTREVSDEPNVLMIE